MMVINLTTSSHLQVFKQIHGKKGLEAVLQPNSTLVMTASARSEKEVVPLQNSTLVMFESKTSTGHHQERGSAAERTLCKVPSMPNMPSVLKHVEQCVYVSNVKFSEDGGRSFVTFQP